MKTRKYIFAGAIISLLVISGCSFFYRPIAASPVKILVYADTMDVARKVAALLAETPNILATPVAELKKLDATYIEGFDVIALLPVKVDRDHFPADILRGLQNFVYKNGKGIIGMHDVLFLSPLMHEIFGGSAEIIPTDGLTSDLSITIHDYPLTSYHSWQLTYGILGQFTLTLEHPMRTKLTPDGGIGLFDMSYKTVTGTTETYCAGWSYSYGKGFAFFFAPGDKEETRYNPNVIRMIINVAVWMALDKRYYGAY
jgi:hypothetical protein